MRVTRNGIKLEVNDIPEIKTCPRCKESRELKYWGKDATRCDGLQTYCKICRNPGLRDYKAKLIKSKREYRYKYKFIVVAHYSMGEMRCRECPCNDLFCLQIDHIEGGGNQHREELKSKKCNLYHWLINNDFPEGFQVLCANCNVRKRIINKESRLGIRIYGE